MRTGRDAVELLLCGFVGLAAGLILWHALAIYFNTPGPVEIFWGTL